MLEAYLAERDVPCPSCAYNLRGVRTGKCPECGRTLSLLEHRTIDSTPHLFGLVVLYGLMGSLIWEIASAIHYATFRRSPYFVDDWYQMVLISRGSALWVAIMLVVAWSVLRKPFLRQPLLVQWLLAAASLGVYAIVFLITHRFAG